MSDEIEIVIDSNETIVESELIVDVISNNNIVDIESLEPEFEVTFKKQEYVITGDDMYIPLSYDEAPQWLKDTIANITDLSLNQKITELNSLTSTLNGLINELNIAKNTYTNSIISSAEIDERINARIETLNSSIADSQANIVDMISTKATPDQATSLALSVLTSSIDSGAIGSLVSNLQNTMSTTNSTLSNNIDIVHSEMTGDFEANADVIDTIQTYVTNINGTLTSHAGQITSLQTSASTVDGKISTANSEVINTVNTTIANGDAVVTSKWAYNSNLNIGGNNYSSGFGLSNSAGTGVGSEFWIDASRLKFTNTNKTGSKAPFTIDATGTTPEITFNGKVSFSNVNGANMSGSNLLYNSAPAIGFETKGWQADYNITGIVSSGILATGDPYRPTGAGSFHQYIPGTPPVNTVFDMRAIGSIPVIGGQFYEGSAYLNSHRCDSRIYVAWMDSAGAVITWSMGDIVTQTNTTNVLVTWGRSKFITQAPSNAASCYFYIRGTSTGQANPYVFVSMCYFGRASEGQSVFSNWSEGISAGATNTAELVNNSGFTTLSAVASQGYVLPAGVANAINTNTTTVDGSKITTGSINANKINTVGLIAENISANEIVGKTITGGSISGAIIEGSIIKASYLDLNGQLKVLTDYIISVAMYNANPSLYTDAVYISVYNNYRIPTLSVVKESNSVFTNIYLAGSIYNGSIFSYSTANAGTLLKAQKIRPPVTVLENTDIISSVSYKPWWYNINYHVCNHFRLSLNGITLIEVHVAYQSRAGGPEGNLEYSVTNISGNLISPINITRHRDSDSTYTPLIYNLDLGIKDVVLQHTCTTGGGAGYEWNYNFNTEIKITLNSGTRIMPFDWTSGNIKFEQLVNANGSNSFTLKNIQITNLDL